jgi:hypothetical protein
MALDIWDITSGTVVQHGPVDGSLAVEQTVGTPVALYVVAAWHRLDAWEHPQQRHLACPQRPRAI